MKHTLILAMVMMVMIASSCTSRQNVAINHKDSIEYAVYATKSIDSPHYVEPIYIPVAILGAYIPGDTALETQNGMLVEFPLRDSETKQPILDGLHKVLIQERMRYNKWFAK